MAMRSALARPGRTSTSTPRPWKMPTAAGLSSSATRTLGIGATPERSGERGEGAGEGPVEPRRQPLDIGGLDGGAAPDPQARRRVAVAGDVVGDPLLVEEPGQLLDEARLA